MICLDSDCIIDFLNGKGDAKLVVSKYFEEIVTTEINAFEIFFGIYNQKIIDKKEFLREYKVIYNELFSVIMDNIRKENGSKQK